MVDKSYIIQAHKNPKQLARLIARLHDGGSHFFIHIDLKSDINPFLLELSEKHITFVQERVNCIWGDFSQVLATISLLKAVRQSGRTDRVIFLSGQDYPIKSNQFINKFLLKNNSYNFVTYWMDPISVDSLTYKVRIKEYKFNVSDKPKDFLLLTPLNFLKPSSFKSLVKAMILRKGKKINYKLLLKERNSPFKNHYKGSSWWSFNYDTWRKVLEYVEQNEEKLYSYYKHTLCADEQFFHTILRVLMKTDVHIKIKSNLHYIDWSSSDGSHPKVFSFQDFDIIKKQSESRLFARKFDQEFSSDILDMIDDKIHSVKFSEKSGLGEQ